MNTLRKTLRARLLLVTAIAVATTGIATTLSSGPAGAQGGLQANVAGPQGPPVFFTGGEYAWHVDVSTSVDPTDSATPISYTFTWGDGTSDANVAQDVQQCSSNGEFSCWMERQHVYTAPGLYEVSVSVVQSGVASQQVSSGQFMVWQIDSAVRFFGSGTVEAQPLSGGHFDSDFTGGPVYFKFDASRPRGSTATNATVDVSVPSMTPDVGSAGMQFHGTAVLEPLYAAPMGARGTDVVLGQLFGRITHGDGSPAGTGYAVLHAQIVPGEQPQMRILIQNSSAGYTYIDTGTLFNDEFYPLYPLLDHDFLLSGRVQVR